MPAIRQITIFRFKGRLPSEMQEKIFKQLRQLDTDTGADQIGVVHMVEWARDRRKVDFIQDTTFPDGAAYEHWRSHPAHVAVVELLSMAADWTSALIDLP